MEHLKSIIKENKILNIREASPELIKEIQKHLKEIGYKLTVDSVVGEETLNNWYKFKKDNFLGEKELIGKTTAETLIQEVKDARGEPHDVNAEQLIIPVLIGDLGSKTGNSAVLPVVGKVYENEFIVENGNLTWGEFTKGLTRVPYKDYLVHNAIHLAKIFRQVRDKAECPLFVTSGFRPPDVNRAIGGASQSKHITCQALDIIPSNRNFRKLFDILKATPGIGGIGDAAGILGGRSKGFCHMDTRSYRVIFTY